MIDKKSFEAYEYEPYKGGYKIIGFSEEKTDADELFGLYLPNGTTAIEEFAFAGLGVTTVKCPSSLIEIGDNAFSGCKHLTDITFDEGSQLRRIGDAAFEETSLKRITLPRTLEEICDDAFLNCENLISVNFGELTSLLRIGSEAFSGCSMLETAALPGGLSAIDFEAFSGCSNLTFVGIPASVRVMEFDVFAGCRSLSQINVDLAAIPEDWDEDFLGDCSATVNLMDCRGYTPISKLKLKPYPYGEGQFTVLGPAEWGIEELNLHPKITDIAKFAFKEQLNLRNFKANAPYVVIGSEAFACSGLKEIDFEDGYICDSAFTWTAVNRAILTRGFDFSAYRHSAVKSLVLSKDFPSSSTILPYTFSHTRFTEFRVPDEFNSIGHHAFMDCVNLERLDLNKVETISEGAFQGCGALKEIIFPKNKCLVWERAFKECLNLESVEIYDGTNISKEMFYSCHALREVTLWGKRTHFYEDSFAVCPIRKFVLKDTYSYELEKTDMDRLLSRIIANRGDKVSFVFKDKTVVKTKSHGTYWN